MIRRRTRRRRRRRREGRQVEEAGGGGQRDGETGGALVHRLEVVLGDAGTGERQRPERLDQRGGVDARA